MQNTLENSLVVNKVTLERAKQLLSDKGIEKKFSDIINVIEENINKEGSVDYNVLLSNSQSICKECLKEAAAAYNNYNIRNSTWVTIFNSYISFEKYLIEAIENPIDKFSKIRKKWIYSVSTSGAYYTTIGQLFNELWYINQIGFRVKSYNHDYGPNNSIINIGLGSLDLFNSTLFELYTIVSSQRDLIESLLLNHGLYYLSDTNRTELINYKNKLKKIEKEIEEKYIN